MVQGPEDGKEKGELPKGGVPTGSVRTDDTAGRSDRSLLERFREWLSKDVFRNRHGRYLDLEELSWKDEDTGLRKLFLALRVRYEASRDAWAQNGAIGLLVSLVAVCVVGVAVFIAFSEWQTIRDAAVAEREVPEAIAKNDGLRAARLQLEAVTLEEEINLRHLHGAVERARLQKILDRVSKGESDEAIAGPPPPPAASSVPPAAPKSEAAAASETTRASTLGLWQMLVATSGAVLLTLGAAGLLFRVAERFWERARQSLSDANQTKRIEAAVRLVIGSGAGNREEVKEALGKLAVKMIEEGPRQEVAAPDLSTVPDVVREYGESVLGIVKATTGKKE